jgi:hypothetical protein
MNKLTLGEVYNRLAGYQVKYSSIHDLPRFTDTLIDLEFSSALITGKEEKLNTLFSEYVLPQMLNEYALEYDSELETENDACTNVLGLMFYQMLKKYNQYALIIDKYENIKDNLVDNADELISESVRKFNDTPQEEGNYSADDYTSTINQDTTTSDNPNKKMNIEKLIALQNSLANTYQIWANEIFRYVAL